MYDVDQQELVSQLSDELKGTITMPDWAQFVKTGHHKERPPVDDDWWYDRAASVLRQVELKGPIGVSKLRYKYGGRKTSRGMKPEHFYKGSGKVIRTILQQLEDAGLVEKGQKGVHKGRITTSDGKSLIFQTAQKMDAAGSKKKSKSKKQAKKAEKKESDKKEEEGSKKEEQEEEKESEDTESEEADE